MLFMKTSLKLYCWTVCSKMKLLQNFENELHLRNCGKRNDDMCKFRIKCPPNITLPKPKKKRKRNKHNLLVHTCYLVLILPHRCT